MSASHCFAYNTDPQEIQLTHYHYLDSASGELLTELLVRRELQCAHYCSLQLNCNGYRTVSVDRLHRCSLLALADGAVETFTDVYFV